MDEQAFQNYYAYYAKQWGLNPNPDDPNHHYDYRAAFEAGAGPNAEGHWPSQFKTAEHPNRYVFAPGGQGIMDSITGGGPLDNLQLSPEQLQEMNQPVQRSSVPQTGEMDESTMLMHLLGADETHPAGKLDALLENLYLSPLANNGTPIGNVAGTVLAFLMGLNGQEVPAFRKGAASRQGHSQVDDIMKLLKDQSVIQLNQQKTKYFKGKEGQLPIQTEGMKADTNMKVGKAEAYGQISLPERVQGARVDIGTGQSAESRANMELRAAIEQQNIQFRNMQLGFEKMNAENQQMRTQMDIGNQQIQAMRFAHDMQNWAKETPELDKALRIASEIKDPAERDRALAPIIKAFADKTGVDLGTKNEGWFKWLPEMLGGGYGRIPSIQPTPTPRKHGKVEEALGITPTPGAR